MLNFLKKPTSISIEFGAKLHETLRTTLQGKNDEEVSKRLDFVAKNFEGYQQIHILLKKFIVDFNAGSSIGTFDGWFVEVPVPVPMCSRIANLKLVWDILLHNQGRILPCMDMLQLVVNIYESGRKQMGHGESRACAILTSFLEQHGTLMFGTNLLSNWRHSIAHHSYSVVVCSKKEVRTWRFWNVSKEKDQLMWRWSLPEQKFNVLLAVLIEMWKSNVIADPSRIFCQQLPEPLHSYANSPVDFRERDITCGLRKRLDFFDSKGCDLLFRLLALHLKDNPDGSLGWHMPVAVQVPHSSRVYFYPSFWEELHKKSSNVNRSALLLVLKMDLLHLVASIYECSKRMLGHGSCEALAAIEEFMQRYGETIAPHASGMQVMPWRHSISHHCYTISDQTWVFWNIEPTSKQMTWSWSFPNPRFRELLTLARQLFDAGLIADSSPVVDYVPHVSARSVAVKRSNCATSLIKRFNNFFWTCCERKKKKKMIVTVCLHN